MRTSTAAVLAVRTLQARPRRTLLLVLGYGLGVAVMIALLAVGDALVLQARDRDVVAGGDLVLVPAGIDAEVLKTGAATAMFLVMPNARFLAQEVLMGPRYAETIAAVSPEMIDKLLYVRVRGRIVAARASGALPSASAATHSHLAVGDPQWRDQEGDRAWMTPSPQQQLQALDRFHAPPAGPEGRTWAEWWYFNFAADNGQQGYVSFIVDRGRRVRVAVTFHMPGGRTIRWLETHPATALPIDGAAAAIAAGPHRVELRNGTYRIRLDRIGAHAHGGARPPLSVDLVFAPRPGWYLPPVERQSAGFRSGYVVPALRATVRGTLRFGGRTSSITGIGYHDHNWGVWQAVTWEWGTASTVEYALLAGVVRHPQVREREMLVTLFGTAGNRAGVLGVLRGSAPEFSGWNAGPRVGGVVLRAPGRLEYRAANDAGDRLRVEFIPEHIVATLQDAPVSGREVFLQMRGRYVVVGSVGGRVVRMTAQGYAETFAPLRTRR